MDLDVDRLRELDLSSDELKALAEKVVDRCTPGEIPKCRVCGEALSIQACGGGAATCWGCSEWEEIPGTGGKLRRKAGRKCADGHYSESCWTEPASWDYAKSTLGRAVLAFLEAPTAPALIAAAQEAKELRERVGRMEKVIEAADAAEVARRAVLRRCDGQSVDDQLYAIERLFEAVRAYRAALADAGETKGANDG